MKSEILQIENIKCGGCAAQITSVLNKEYPGMGVDVNYEEGEVKVTGDELPLDKVLATLKRMGYAQRGESTALDSAKSYVSCMVGKVKNAG
jgi:copper chaperone